MQKQVSAIISLKDRFSGPLLQMSKNIEGLDKETRSSMNRVNRWSNQVVKGVDKAVKATAKWAKRGAILGAGWSIKSGFEGASELDYASRKVKSIAGDRLDMDGIRKDIKKFSFEFGKAYEEIGDGMYNAISASIPMDLLGEAVKLGDQLSIAGFTDMDSSIKLMASTMNAFDMKTSEEMQNMADQFLTTQNLGVITVDEMAQYYGRISTLSAQIGASLEEQNAAMATMTMRGMTQREATTSYRSILNAFLKDTTDSQAAVLEKMGLGGDFLSAKTFKELGFSGVVERVAEAAKGDLDLVSQIFKDIRGKTGAIMFGPDAGMEDYQRILGELENQKNPLDDAHEEMNQSITRQWAIFKQRIKTLNDELYTEKDGVGGYLVQELKDANDWLDENREDLIEKINDTSERIIEGSKEIGEFAVKNESPLKKLGKTVLGMYAFTKVTGWIGSFSKAIGSVKDVIKALFKGELFVGGKLTGLITAIFKPAILGVKDGVAGLIMALAPLAKAAALVLKTIAIIIATIVGIVWVLIVALRALSAWEEGGWRAGLQSIKDDWGSTTSFIEDGWDNIKRKFSGGMEFGGFKIKNAGILSRQPKIEDLNNGLLENPLNANLGMGSDVQQQYAKIVGYYYDNPIESKIVFDTSEFEYGSGKVKEEHGFLRRILGGDGLFGKVGLKLDEFRKSAGEGVNDLNSLIQHFSENSVMGIVPMMDFTQFDESSKQAKESFSSLNEDFKNNPIKTSINLDTSAFEEEMSYVQRNYNLLDTSLKSDTATGNTILLRDEFQKGVVEVEHDYEGLVTGLSSKDAIGNVGINGYDSFMTQIYNMNRSWINLNNSIGSKPTIGPPNRPANYIEGKYKGTTSWKGGPVQVHERGGEIMDVPGGTRIYPHDESVRMAREDGASAVLAGAGGQSINVSLGGVNFLGDFNTKADINEIGTKIVERIKTELKNI